MKSKLRSNRLLADFLGYGCLLLVPLVGWLPGPGGVPLLLAGLSLLSIHNPWARRATTYVKKHSTRVREIAFPPERHIMFGWDIVTFVLLGCCLLAYRTLTSTLAYPICTVLLFASGIIIAYNRNRLERIKLYISNNKLKK